MRKRSRTDVTPAQGGGLSAAGTLTPFDRQGNRPREVAQLGTATRAQPAQGSALTSRRLKVISRLDQKWSENSGYMSSTSSRSSRWILCRSQ